MTPEPPSPDDNNARMAMKQIRIAIKQILDRWDPLCLRGLPGFVNEYNDVVGPLAIMVRKRTAAIDIAAHLHRLMTEEWRMAPDRAKCLEIAEKIHRTGAFLDHPPGP
jgi:hypothetical protein